MIKYENKTVMLDVENEQDLMQSFVHITNAVHLSLKTQGKKTEEEATMMVLDAVGFALDIDWNEEPEEPETPEQPEVPKSLEDLVRRIVKEELETEELTVLEAEIPGNVAEDILKGLNAITLEAKKDGEK